MNCPDCGKRMRRDDSREMFLCDNPTCARAAGGGAWRDRESLVQWVTNAGDPIAPPDDWVDWVARVRKRHGVDIFLVFVARERDQWHVGTAELRPALQPGPTHRIAPVDLRREVTALLRAAGKPVVD